MPETIKLEKRLRPALEAIADAHERKLRLLGSPDAPAFGWVVASEHSCQGNTVYALADRGLVDARGGRGKPVKCRPTRAGYAALDREVPVRMQTRAEEVSDA